MKQTTDSKANIGRGGKHPLLPMKKTTIEEQIVKLWIEKRKIDDSFWIWVCKEKEVSYRLFKKLVEQELWNPNLVTRLKKLRLHPWRRKIIRSREKFFEYLNQKGISVRNYTIRESFLKLFSPQRIPTILRLIKIKSQGYMAGAIMSTLHPENKKEKENKTITTSYPQALYGFFEGLITRHDFNLVQKAVNIVQDRDIMIRARDSLSLKERKNLYDAVQMGYYSKSFWEWRKSPELEPAKRVEALLRGRCKNKKAIITILDLISNQPQKPGKGYLTIKIGGCSLKDINIPSNSVGCCYFKGGGYEKELSKWIISPDHITLLIEMVGKKCENKTKKEYIGVVMLFIADDGDTMVIDSVHGLSGTLDDYSGWRELILFTIKENALRLKVQRIVFNKCVYNDFGMKYVDWVKENYKTEKMSKPVRIPKYLKTVKIDFNPKSLIDSFEINPNKVEEKIKP